MKLKNWFDRLFGRNKKEVRFALQVQKLLADYEKIGGIRDKKLLEVNQQLTQSLCDNALLYSNAAENPGDEFSRRYHYIALQLVELMQLREEIRNIHLRMEEILVK